MSVQSEINRIKANIASAYTVLGKLITLPTTKNSANLPTTVQTLVDSLNFSGIINAIHARNLRGNSIPLNNIIEEIKCLPYNYDDLSIPLGRNISNIDNAYEAVKVAMTYWNSKYNDTEVYSYVDGSGLLKGDTSAELHDASGKAVMDCSTYIGLILRGIPYEESPFNNSTAMTIDPRTVVCFDKTWVERHFDLQANRFTTVPVFPTYEHKTSDDMYRVLTASDMCQYYDRMGLTWFANSGIQPRVGDICFFYKEDTDGTLRHPNRFLGISHVGIMISPTHYLNMTDYENSGNLILTAVSTRPPYMYARPLYGALVDGVKTELTPNKVDFIPSSWSSLRQGSTIGANNAQLVVEGKKLTITGKGTGTSHPIISPNCPLYLPKGTYRLAGVTNNTGGNNTTNHSLFGVRVYNADTDEGITGKTFTSNGTIYNDRTPVWDIGGGAEFTLEKDTRIRIDAYFSASVTFNGLTVEPTLYKIA